MSNPKKFKLFTAEHLCTSKYRLQSMQEQWKENHYSCRYAIRKYPLLFCSMSFHEAESKFFQHCKHFSQSNQCNKRREAKKKYKLYLDDYLNESSRSVSFMYMCFTMASWLWNRQEIVDLASYTVYSTFLTRPCLSGLTLSMHADSTLASDVCTTPKPGMCILHVHVRSFLLRFSILPYT